MSRTTCIYLEDECSSSTAATASPSSSSAAVGGIVQPAHTLQSAAATTLSVREWRSAADIGRVSGMTVFRFISSRRYTFLADEEVNLCAGREEEDATDARAIAGQAR